MQVWNISPSTTPSPGSRGATMRTPAVPGSDAVSGLVECIARDDFGLRALSRLNQAMPVAWWSVYKVYSDRPPELCTLGQFGVPDIALECFRVYRAGPYRYDTAFLQARDQARGGATGRAVLAHCMADDFGAVHREQIYQRHSLSERLSVVSGEPAGASAGEGGLLAINLYRHRAQARFNATEIDTVFELASPLMAVVRRHLELSPGDPAAGGEAAPPTSMRRLELLCPALTERETQVCERMLRGWTFEGIAADLCLSVATVKTYRNRAFKRLDIHFRNQLFGLVLGSEADTAQS